MQILRTNILWLIVLLAILSGCDRSKKSYWDNGSLRSDLNYKDGKLNGLAVWYFENGVKEQEANYINNKLSGVMKRWYASGIPESVSNYNHGLLDGKAITYDEGGAKTLEESYKNDTLDGPFRQWYKNGQIMIGGSYKSGLFNGRWMYYEVTGQIVGVGNFEQGSGIQKAWWPNGNLKREVHYKDNLKHGEERIYNAEEKLEKMIVYREGIEID